MKHRLNIAFIVIVSSLALVGCASVEVNKATLDNALSPCQLISDGTKLEVMNEGKFLAGKETERKNEPIVENFWRFTTPQQHLPIDRYITRRNYLDTTRQDFYARITRHGLKLAIELVRGDGDVAAVCDLPVVVVDENNKQVLRHETHYVETGDHPAVHVTFREDFFVTKNGDWLIRRQEERFAWMFYYPFWFKTGCVISFKNSPQPTLKEDGIKH